MGKDKALLPFKEAPTLAWYQVHRLRPHFSALYLSAKEDKFGFDTPLIADEGEEFAPTVALATILKKLDTPWVAVVAVDIPLVGPEVFAALWAAKASGDAAVVPVADGQIHTMCALYHRSFLPLLEAAVAKGHHKLTRLLEESQTRFVTFEDPTVFANLNHPGEYTALTGTQP